MRLARGPSPSKPFEERSLTVAFEGPLAFRAISDGGNLTAACKGPLPLEPFQLDGMAARDPSPKGTQAFGVKQGGR